MIIDEIKSALPLEGVIADAGVVLRHRKALCPFHEDTKPSFSIKGERWRCFTCDEGGDVIDFAKKFYGLNTKGAIRFLAKKAGISQRQITQSERCTVRRGRREREAVAEFSAWEQTTINSIAEVLRAYYRMFRKRRNTFTEVELQDLAKLQCNIDILNYHYEILCGRDNFEKFQLWKQEVVYHAN